MADSINSSNVRQLCLRLKPILGAKMDHIYEAYLAEDDDGRKQVHLAYYCHSALSVK